MPSPPSYSAYLDHLSNALTTVVDEGRIGLPRFIRWTDRIDLNDSVGESLSSAVEICNRVFGTQAAREFRSGDDVLHGTILAVWANGSSALISVGPGGSASNAGPEIMLLGSSGAMYFDGTLSGAPMRGQMRTPLEL